MKKHIKYFLLVHTAVLLIAGFGVRYILVKFFPDIMVDNYYIIPVFFYLLGIIFIFRLKQNSAREPKKLVNLYMLMRMVKIFISISFIILYWIFHKNNIRNFAIIFAIFYLINLISETYIYMRMELYFKYKGEQQDKTNVS